MFINHCILSVVATLIILLNVAEANHGNYPVFFFNKTGCLYAYMEIGNYLIAIPDNTDLQAGVLKEPKYDESRSTCVEVAKPGLLVVDFVTRDNNMNSMSLELSVTSSKPAGYWEISKALLKIDPVNKHIFPKNEIELKAMDLYAGLDFSFSCSSLVLQNLVPPGKDGGPSFRITLKRFQLQPFHELPNVVFAPSYDCSVWLTLPLISGLILVLFIIFTVMIGVYLLAEQGNQTGDLKFSKQGGMLMNQAQLDATKG